MSREEYKFLGQELIFYKDRYWLADTYNDELYGGGWFASPIYETVEGLEVRPAGGNWCFKSRGAIVLESLTPIQKLQVYDSWIKHLKFSRKIVLDYTEEVNKYNEKI